MARLTTRLPVRHIQLVLVVTATLMILVVGVTGVLLGVFASRGLTHFDEDVRPAVQANAAFYQDMLTARVSLDAFAVSGVRGSLGSYRQALEARHADGRPLADFGDRDSSVRALYRREEAAAKAWIHEYARPRLAQGRGTGVYDAAQFDRGMRLFATIQRAQAAQAARLDQEYAYALSKGRLRLKVTLGVISAVTLLGSLMVALLGWRVTEQVRRPLVALSGVVERLAAGDYLVRAQVEGPPEVRRVSQALNSLADEIGRGRDVEAAIQHQLRAVDSAKSDFVSNVSHELRTPLTVINGYLELLADALADTDAEAELGMLTAAQRNVQRLKDLIEDLLTLDRAERIEAELAPVDLSAIVQAVASDLRLSASNRGIRIFVDCPTAPMIVRGDAVQLRRAVLNVMNNAVKFSYDGGSVEASVEPGRDNVLLTVLDRGIGIPRNELSQLGSRFFRASNAVKNEIAGTGLGLRIVQTVVANHFGTLTLDSPEETGTEVRLTLPLCPPAVADAPDREGNKSTGGGVLASGLD